MVLEQEKQLFSLIEQGKVDPEVIWCLDQLMHLKNAEQYAPVLSELMNELLKDKPSKEVLAQKITTLTDKVVNSNILKRSVEFLAVILITLLAMVLVLPVGIIYSPVLMYFGIKKIRAKKRGFFPFIRDLPRAFGYAVVTSLGIILLAFSQIMKWRFSKGKRLSLYAIKRLNAVSNKKQMFQPVDIAEDKKAFSKFLAEFMDCSGKKHNIAYNDDTPVRLIPYGFATSVFSNVYTLKGCLGNHASMAVAIKQGDAYINAKIGFDLGIKTRHKEKDYQSDAGLHITMRELFYVWRAHKQLLSKRYDFYNRNHHAYLLQTYFPSVFDCHTYISYLVSNIPLSSDQLAIKKHYIDRVKRFGGNGNNAHSQFIGKIIPETPVHYTELT